MLFLLFIQYPIALSILFTYVGTIFIFLTIDCTLRTLSLSDKPTRLGLNAGDKPVNHYLVVSAAFGLLYFMQWQRIVVDAVFCNPRVDEGK